VEELRKFVGWLVGLVPGSELRSLVLDLQPRAPFLIFRAQKRWAPMFGASLRLRPKVTTSDPCKLVPWPHRDEDINTLATIIPSVEILDPITRSRAQQLNCQVNSFLCSSANNIEIRLLSNDLIIPRNQGEDHGGQMEHQEAAEEPRRRAREGGEPIQFGIAEFESNSEYRTIPYLN
jgi:hypothetical protein